MTTPSTERKAGPLLGTGVQTTWPFTFKVFAATDIAVTIANSLGVETALTYGVDYTVSLNANQETSPGGTVTYPISGSPLPIGSRLVIVGNLPYDQPLDLPAGGNFSPLALENQLDRTVMQIQQLAEKTSRALQVSITTDADVTLPPPAASQLISWDSTGENLQNVPLTDIGTAIAYGTYRYDTFTGNGSTTTFALSEDPAALANLDVSISGVVQVPGTDYSLVNGSLVFASAPANGTTILARYGQALPVIPDSDQVSFVQAGSGAVTRTVQNKLRDVVSVKDFGAVGDGVADDTAALNTAEAAAYAAGVMLYVPAGTYNYNGVWSVRVNLYGYNATIQQTATTYAGNVNAVIYVNANNLLIQGISVDGNLYRTGFASDGKSELTFRDCSAKNCVNGGYMNYYGNDILLDRCYAENVRYAPGNSAADGFIFVSCTRSTWRDCEATNFRRIGFVSEGIGLPKSDQIVGLRCIAHNANNCDDSPTEFNAAFWAENTNSVDWVDCVGYNLAGNPGQTSGRVRGLYGVAVGNNKVGTANLVRCRIYGGAGYLPVGITVEGSSNYATVNITDCYVDKARVAVGCLCGFNSVNITRLTMNDIVNVNSSDGGIVFDATGGRALDNLVIDTVIHQNSTFTGGGGLVKFFVTPTSCNYIFKNTNNATHVMTGSCASITVENCEVACGSTIGVGSFGASSVSFNNCLLTSRNNANTDEIVQTSSLPSQANVYVRNSSIGTLSGYWNPELGGSDIYLYCDNVKFFSFGWKISITGDYQVIFRNCQVYDVPPTYGLIYTNFNAPSRQILIVQNCYFQAVNVANTPLRKWNNDPTDSIIQGNIYRNITSLYDFTSGVTQANNVSI